MFVGFKGKQILFLSDSSGLPSPDYDVTEWDLPTDTSPSDIIRNYEIWRNNVVEKTAVKPYGQLRVALVGVYRIQCGIATYAEQLFPRMAAQVGECRIFAEKADGVPEEENVVRCWLRGEPLVNI